jgi:hypothetical protein
VTVLALVQISSEKTNLNGQTVADGKIEEEKKGNEND